MANKPKTIRELKDYCRQRGMPLRRMRFFIGENYPKPKAFGIYQEGDEFIVYKNKEDGSRSIRYQGNNEKYAVGELYQKLLDECHKRQIFPENYPGPMRNAATGTRRSPSGRKKRRTKRRVVFGVVLAIILAVGIYHIIIHSHDGYYRTDRERLYYKYGNRWYESLYNWYRTDGFPEDNYQDYYAGNTYQEEWGGKEFDYAEARNDGSIRNGSGSRNGDNSDTGYSPDTSGDFDPWDPGDTDWGPDW